MKVEIRNSSERQTNRYHKPQNINYNNQVEEKGNKMSLSSTPKENEDFEEAKHIKRVEYIFTGANDQSKNKIEIINITEKKSEPNGSYNITNAQPTNSVIGRWSNKEKGLCPMYYGIRSYIHHFYSPPDQSILKNGEYTQGNELLAFSEKRRKKIFWVRVGLWIALNFTLIGTITTFIGYFAPRREIVVGKLGNYAVLDLWAVSYNNRLELCQLTGMISLLSGSVFFVSCLLIYSCSLRRTPSYHILGIPFLPTMVDTTIMDPWIIPNYGSVNNGQLKLKSPK